MAQRQSFWKVARGLCPTQVFPAHIPIFLDEFQMDMKISEKAHLSFTQWSQKWLARLNSVNELALLSHECCFYGVSIKRFLINHPSFDMGWFANQAFPEGKTAGY